MNIFQIIELALSLARRVSDGKGDKVLTKAQVFEAIVKEGIAAYRIEAGQPLDLDKLKPQPPIA